MGETTADAGKTASMRVVQEWLAWMAGDWRYEATASMPDGSSGTTRGTTHVRTLGRTWAIGESWGDDPSDLMSVSILTLGYDPARARWAGTFVSAGMPHLWIYDGTLDAAGRLLTLETEGPGLADERATEPYRDTIERMDDDEYVMRSHHRGVDGAWQAFMSMRYTRTSPVATDA